MPIFAAHGATDKQIQIQKPHNDAILLHLLKIYPQITTLRDEWRNGATWILENAMKKPVWEYCSAPRRICRSLLGVDRSDSEHRQANTDHGEPQAHSLAHCYLGCYCMRAGQDILGNGAMLNFACASTDLVGFAQYKSRPDLKPVALTVTHSPKPEYKAAYYLTYVSR